MISAKMAETDRQGRLSIPREIRERYGEKYHIVPCEDRVELIPVADDPLAAVREAAGELREVSAEEIQAEIQAAAKADGRAQDELEE